MSALTPEQAEQLEEVRAKARARHEKARAAAKARGRKDFPALPYECSWAFEQEFTRSFWTVAR